MGGDVAGTVGEDRLFVGRSAELRALGAAADAVRAGRTQAVLIEGEAGVGKTALVRRWLAGEAEGGATVLRAFCDAAEEDLAFGAVGQLVGRAPRDVKARFALLGEAGPPAGASAVQVGAQLLGVLDELQASGPVLMVVEDVHWADVDSRRALGFVLRQLDADQVLAVFTARPPAPKEIRAPAAERSRVLTLTGLGEAPVAELLEATTGRRPDPGTVERLRKHTEGNPLYLRTLLAEVPTETLLHSGPDRPLPVPGTLAAAVRARLHALPDDSRALVEASAVLGTRSPLHIVGQLAEVPDPATALAPAQTANLLRWWPTEPTASVMVTHALQRDAIIAALPPARRRALHAAAAELVDVASSWRHRVAAADGPAPRLAGDLEHAAHQCLAANAVDRAATLLLWASGIAPTSEERERLLLTAAVRLLWATRISRVTDLLPAIEACASTPLRSLAMGSYAMVVGQLDRAENDLTRAFEAARTDPALHWVASIAGGGLAYTQFLRGTHGERITRFSQQALALENRDPYLTYIARSSLPFGWAYMEGPRRGLDELHSIAPLPRAHQVSADDAWLLTYRGTLRVLCGMPTAGREDLTHALALSEREASQGLEEYAHMLAAVASYWTGDWDAAAMHGGFAITTATTEQRLYAYGEVYAAASFVSAGRGEVDQARKLLHAAEQYSLPFSAALVQLGWAVEAQARADWPAMLESVSGLLRAPAGRVACFPLLWKPLQVEALIRNQHLGPAATALDELRAMTTSYPTLNLAAAWLSGQLAEADGDPRTARARYETGLGLPATPDEHALHRAFLEHAYGRLLAQHDPPEQARTWLERAGHRYGAMQAAAFLTRCEADLGGLTPGRAAPAVEPVLGRLTHKERDIAHLIGEGLTNKEIAARLYVSSKTVEYHLGHVYANLSLRGRRELRDLVQSHTRLT